MSGLDKFKDHSVFKASKRGLKGDWFRESFHEEKMFGT